MYSRFVPPTLIEFLDSPLNDVSVPQPGAANDSLRPCAAPDSFPPSRLRPARHRPSRHRPSRPARLDTPSRHRPSRHRPSRHARLDTARLDTARRDATRRRATRLDTARLGAARRDATRRRATRRRATRRHATVGTPPSARHPSARLPSARLPLRPLPSRPRPSPCTGGDPTRGGNHPSAGLPPVAAVAPDCSSGSLLHAVRTASRTTGSAIAVRTFGKMARAVWSRSVRHDASLLTTRPQLVPPTARGAGEFLCPLRRKETLALAGSGRGSGEPRPNPRVCMGATGCFQRGADGSPPTSSALQRGPAARGPTGWLSNGARAPRSRSPSPSARR
jgi:hypothetical protein